MDKSGGVAGPFRAKRRGVDCSSTNLRYQKKEPPLSPVRGDHRGHELPHHGTLSRNPAWILMWAPLYIGRRVSIPLTDDRVAEWGLAAHHTNVGFGGTLAFNPTGPAQ